MIICFIKLAVNTLNTLQAPMFSRRDIPESRSKSILNLNVLFFLPKELFKVDYIIFSPFTFLLSVQSRGFSDWYDKKLLCIMFYMSWLFELWSVFNLSFEAFALNGVGASPSSTSLSMKSWVNLRFSFFFAFLSFCFFVNTVVFNSY